MFALATAPAPHRGMGSLTPVASPVWLSPDGTEVAFAKASAPLAPADVKGDYHLVAFNDLDEAARREAASAILSDTFGLSDEAGDDIPW